jgi:hypothetical protein
MRRTILVVVALFALWGAFRTWHGTAAAIANTQTVPTSAADVQITSADDIRQGYAKHAALAQYYRWYLVYENDQALLDNAIDILDPNVRVKSVSGEAKGHDAYRGRVAKLPKAWDNAHDVKSVDVTINPDGTIGLLAQIRYLNRGMLPNGGVRAGDLTYRTRLRRSEALLPKFLDIEIIQNNESSVPEFVSTYEANRVKSLVHYWLALIENPKRDAEAFREILANDFELNFASGKIDTFEKFKAWYTGPASSISASTHAIVKFAHEEIAPQTFRVRANFDWQGLHPNGTHMVGRSQHEWIVIDNPAERFARIKSAAVTMLVPFQPKP